MMRSKILALCLLCLGTTYAKATPVQLDSTEFATQTAGLRVVTEDFESFPSGPKTQPFTFTNGTFSACEPGCSWAYPFISDNPDRCTSGKCLEHSEPLVDVMFNAFPAGTQYWAADLTLYSALDEFIIVVTGNSGVLRLDRVTVGTSASQGYLGIYDQGFLGFYDPLGIVSVTLYNVGHSTGPGSWEDGFFTFDNVRTAAGGMTPPSPWIVVDPQALSFDLTVREGHKESVVAVSNIGEADLVVSEIGTTNPLDSPFSISAESCVGNPITPETECVINISFDPLYSGTFSDSFNIVSNDPYYPSIDISVTGQAVDLGGQTTGLDLLHVTCENKTQKAKVRFYLDPGEYGIWDCHSAGLPVTSGDEITMKVKGIAK